MCICISDEFSQSSSDPFDNVRFKGLYIKTLCLFLTFFVTMSSDESEEPKT